MPPPARLSRTEQAAFPRALFLHVEIFTHAFLKSCWEAPSTACSVPEANCWCAHSGGGWRGGLLCLLVTAASSFPSEHQASIRGSCRPSALLWIPRQMQSFLLQYWGPTLGWALAEGTPLQGNRLARGPRRRGLTPTVRPPGAGRVGFPHTLTSILRGLKHPLCELRRSGCFPEKVSSQDLGS